MNSSGTPKIAVIYGTRPEYLKFAPLIAAARTSLKVIRVGQHGATFDGESFDCYIPIADYPSTRNRLNEIGASILGLIGVHLESVDQVIVQGDTATAFYGAIAAFQMKKKVIHLEAGMRTYDLANPYPEEGYRQMISRIADLHLTPNIINTMHLNSEVLGGAKPVVGNTILDQVRSYNLTVSRERKILVTLHRRENWGDYKDYIGALTALARANSTYKFLFVAHMNPALQDLLCDAVGTGELPNFIITPPMNHKECATELAQVTAVITDSGGIQEEAAFLGKHIYCIRKKTERDAIPVDYLTTISEPAEIASIHLDITPVHPPCHVYGAGYSITRICTLLGITPSST